MRGVSVRILLLAAEAKMMFHLFLDLGHCIALKRNRLSVKQSFCTHVSVEVGRSSDKGLVISSNSECAQQELCTIFSTLLSPTCVVCPHVFNIERNTHTWKYEAWVSYMQALIVAVHIIGLYSAG